MSSPTKEVLLMVLANNNSLYTVTIVSLSPKMQPDIVSYWPQRAKCEPCAIVGVLVTLASVLFQILWG